MGKKTASKVPLSKLVWQWTESISPENITEKHVKIAYRLGLGKCDTCRKNCAGNPTCLRGLGESAWLKPGNYHNYLEDEIRELKSDVRKEGEFVGLRNLGATCYVNTFLQLWFHNINFRKAVYNYVDTRNNKFPNTACGHLQLLFGMLQSSNRKNIDPTSFVKCLGLDTDLQQDAQEFSKLLLNLLDRTSEVGNFLCEEFCGEYDYCTTCKNCGNVSRRPSKFYELDLTIQGKKDVNQCLEEFFKEEQLDEENQYHCVNCNQKCDASRRIVIKSFPRTLNLQLLRFVFDKTTWNKKKLSSFLSFPDVIDMSRFISSGQTTGKSTVYQLAAVLIHRGPSAFSGHYIAHIKDSSSELWHKFNDEAIEQVKGGRKLDLDALSSEDYEVDMPAPAKKPKVSKNMHTSKDAYMLVYTRMDERDAGQKVEVPGVPPIVQEAVAKDNNDFKSTLDTVISDIKKRVDERSETHSQLGAVLKLMYEMKLEDLVKNCYWVPVAWLKHMLNGADEEKHTFSTEKFLCSHGKLNPDKVASMKCISFEVGNLLFSMSKEETPKLSNEILCLDCVKHRCFLLRLKASLKDDHAMVTKLLKINEDCITDGFLIGRSSLRSWKTKALEKTEVENGEDSSKLNEEDSALPEEVQRQSTNAESSEEEFNFNEDLLCEHGNLTTDANLYRVIPEVAWNIIIKYFPGIRTFRSSTSVSPCHICQEEDYDAAQTAELEKVLASEQKLELCDLYHDRNRPSYEDLYDLKFHIGDECPDFYVVSSEFVKKWREHIQNTSKYEAISQVQNEILLCPHRKLAFDPLHFLNKENFNDSDTGENEPCLVLVWRREWDYISKHFGVDLSISITRHHVKIETQKLKAGNPSRHMEKLEICDSQSTEKGTAENLTANDTVLKSARALQGNKIELIYNPDICQQCIEGRELEKERNLRNYENKEIYIKRVIPNDISTWIKESSLEALEGPARRSKRVHTSRGEKKVIVSSNWSLKHLKIKVMQMFSTPPFDQNLYLQGGKLEGDDVTLGVLAVTPGSTLCLVVDEPDEKSLEMLPVLPDKQAVTEEGFKGTSLLGT